MNPPPTMRAVLLTGHGGPDKLVYCDDVPVPEPAPDEVLIRVGACGMNNTDINTRTGWYAKSVTTATGEQEIAPGEDGAWGGGIDFPRIQGADPAGRIVAAGEAVDPGRIGQRVLVDPWLRRPDGTRTNAAYLGSERDGGFAEYASVPATNAVPIRTDLSDVELASFPCSYAAAEHMLQRAGVSSGQWVLVAGASGGVGVALIQLAKRRAARVVAVTSAAKIDRVREVGADTVLDRAAANLAGKVLDASGGIDVFADVVGGELFAPLLETVRPGGHYTTAGAIGGPLVRLDLRTLYLHDLTMHGATVFPPELFATLVGYIERGEILPVVAGSFPLTQMRVAQEAFMARRHIGSYVIEIEGAEPLKSCKVELSGEAESLTAFPSCDVLGDQGVGSSKETP